LRDATRGGIRTLDDRTHDDQPAVKDAEMPPRRVRLQLVGDGGFDRTH
jgi:hypothetical protein